MFTNPKAAPTRLLFAPIQDPIFPMAADSKAQSSPSDPLIEALARLNNALDSLDIAVDDSIEARKKVRSGDEEVQRMADDRAKLARELDNAEARAVRLASANSEVSRRLVGAMEMVRDVLDKTPG